jgi:hypothetical protein
MDENKLMISKFTTESTVVKWFSVDALPELCFPTVQWAIAHCSSLKGAQPFNKRTNYMMPNPVYGLNPKI